MAVAARQTLDVPTLTVYHEAMRNEVEPAAWDAFTEKAAKEGQFRDWNGEQCIPKLADLRAAYVQSNVLPFVRPPLLKEPEIGHDVYLGAVRAYPRGPREHPLAYIVRIAETVDGAKLAQPLKSMREPGSDDE